MDDAAGTYFLCRRSEAPALLKRAEAEASKILDELAQFYTGDISITARINTHVMGSSIAGDILVGGEICRSYDPIDLCFLELTELMMLRLIKARRTEHGKE